MSIIPHKIIGFGLNLWFLLVAAGRFAVDWIVTLDVCGFLDCFCPQIHWAEWPEQRKMPFSSKAPPLRPLPDGTQVLGLGIAALQKISPAAG